MPTCSDLKYSDNGLALANNTVDQVLADHFPEQQQKISRIWPLYKIVLVKLLVCNIFIIMAIYKGDTVFS